MNRLVSSPPIANVTLKGAIDQINAVIAPTLKVDIFLPISNKTTQETASNNEFSNQDIMGNGACTPPVKAANPVSIRVYKGVVVPRTRSPTLNVNPFPAKILRE
jgi:hypothetical protein